jgi:hypothetical protein
MIVSKPVSAKREFGKLGDLDRVSEIATIPGRDKARE